MKGKGNAQKVKAFFKKNIYYIVMIVCILAIAAMITVAVVLGGEETAPTPTPTPTPGDVTDQNPPDDSDAVNPGDDDTNTPVDGTPEPIVFIVPVEGATIIKDYAMDSLVWSATLKQYSVHPGIDFQGAEGAVALAAYEGVVTEVTYDQLNGNVVKIDHGDGLVTIYSSLEEPVVTEGQTVEQGAELGVIGTTATKEMSDGNHLHFEVSLNGEICNPYDYLSIGDK